jgi:hypothetical protein
MSRVKAIPPESPAQIFGDTHDRSGRGTGDILFTVFTVHRSVRARYVFAP